MIFGLIVVGRGWSWNEVSPSYKGYRIPGGGHRALRVAGHRFPLSFREVEGPVRG